MGWEILGFLPTPELVLGLGSFELMELRPGILPLELDRWNHCLGLKSWEKPVEGETERGRAELGEREVA